MKSPAKYHQFPLCYYLYDYLILIYPAYWQQLALNFCEMVNSQAISIKFETQLHRESLNIITWVHVTMVTKQ